MQQTRESLSNDIWHACDVLRRDNNCGGVMEYIEHLAWLLFLHFLDAQEEKWEMEAQLAGDDYDPILPEDLRWRNGARKDWDAEALLQFVHGRLIPTLQTLSGSPVRETKGTLDEAERRVTENMKIACARRHFGVLDVDYDDVVTAEDVRRQILGG